MIGEQFDKYPHPNTHTHRLLNIVYEDISKNESVENSSKTGSF